jgi:aminoglycoside phosphotransferase (APT) family kinase protein
LARKLVRTAASCPELEQTIVKVVSELERRGEAYMSAGSQPLVQTHGRYHCGHVFVTPGAVTVIDVDRSAPADPAKDVAEFLCRFRIGASKKAIKRRLVDDLGAVGPRIFVEEYERAGTPRLPGLLFYWSATLLGLLADTAQKRHLDDDIRNARLAYYDSEFAELPELVANLGHRT